MGRNIKNTFRIIILILLTLFALSCGEGKTEAPYPTIGSKVIKVDSVNLFIDATPSMQGFAKADVPIFLNLIKNNISGHLGSISSNLRYFEFGDNIRSLSKDDFNKIVDPKFYTGKFKTTNIAKVIDSISKAGKPKFSVVITDFFENENDISSILEKFDGIIKEDLSFGLLGVRTDFDSMIYDVNFKGKDYNFLYKGKRPIYLLLFGQYKAIKEFYEKFQNDLKANYLPLDFNFFIYTKQYAENANNLLDASSASILTKVGNYNIKDNVFEFSGNYYRIKISSKLKAHTISKDYFEQSNEFNDLKVFDGNKKIFPSGFVSLKKNNDIIEVKINRTVDFKSDFFFEAKLKCNTAIQPTQFNSWNMSFIEIAQAINNPNKFDGSKTINLSTFVSQVANKYDSDLGFIQFIIKK